MKKLLLILSLTAPLYPAASTAVTKTTAEKPTAEAEHALKTNLANVGIPKVLWDIIASYYFRPFTCKACLDDIWSIEKMVVVCTNLHRPFCKPCTARLIPFMEAPELQEDEVCQRCPECEQFLNREKLLTQIQQVVDKK